MQHQPAPEGGLEDGLPEPGGVGGLSVEQGQSVGRRGEGVGDAAEDFGGFGGWGDGDGRCF